MKKALLLIVLFSGAVFMAAPVFACPILVQSYPRVGGIIKEPVDHITLTFSGEVEPTDSEVFVTDERGANLVTGKLQGTGDPIQTIFVPLKHLAPGKYKVRYQIKCNCADGHSKIPGTYIFHVQ